MATGISLIIPVKNRRDLLRITLRNVLAQSLQPIEIIVADDHSDDGTPEMVKAEFADRVICISSRQFGAGAARNAGFEVATGSAIQFFDSDDLMTPDKLAIQFELLTKTGTGMVYGPYAQGLETSTGWQQKDVVMQQTGLPGNLPLWQWVARGWCTLSQTCLFSSDLVKEAGPWKTELMPYEDFEYYYRIGQLCEYPTHEDRTFVIYRQHGNQITDNATKLRTRAERHCQALLEMQPHLDGNAPAKTRSFWRARLFAAATYLRKLDGCPDPTPYLSRSTKLHHIGWRLHQRIEFVKTGSNWETMHGISKDTSLFQRSISKIIGTLAQR